LAAEPQKKQAEDILEQEEVPTGEEGLAGREAEGLDDKK